MEASRPPEPFQVIDQKHDRGPRPDGTFGGYWTISASAHGVDFSEVVNDENYNAAYVGQLLGARAATIASVQALGQTPAEAAG